MSNDAGGDFQKIKLDEVPRDAEGRLLMDVFVSIPSVQRYVRYICAGDDVDPERIEALNVHIVPDLFLSAQDFSKIIAQVPADQLAEELERTVIPASIPPEMHVQVIGRDAEKNLKQIFTAFLDPDADPSEMLTRFEQEADKIVDVVAPETKGLKEHLMKNLKYVNLMNDASAITALSILVALATGFDSKKSYRDLTYACLVMDSALSHFSEEEMRQYYLDRSLLPPETLAQMLKHPAKSHELASQKMRSLSEVSLQLILCHHELFNGKGYPRGVRSESLFPMVRVLSLGVDMFEVMKRAELTGKAITPFDAIRQLEEAGVEPHLRRHSKKIVDQTLAFMNSTPLEGI